MKWRLLCLGLLFIPLFDLFHQGLPITHDGQDHVARIANFYLNLSEGNIVPRWAPNLNWGYGHPILMFLYPLPSYLGSLFHLIGFNFVDSTKLVFGVTYLLSGLTMYIWIKELFGNKAAFISALIYSIAPYRFIDLYVRGAIGEHVAFMFVPLVFYFALRLTKNQSVSTVILGAITVAGLVLSHNAISLMFLPLIFLYMAYLVYTSQQKARLMLSLAAMLGMGFGLSAFFWLPAFFEGKYTLRDIVTAGGYKSHFVNFQQFLYGNWNYGGSGQFSVQVGIVQWLFVLLGLFTLFRPLAKETKGFLLALLATFIATLFLMTPTSAAIWEEVSVLQKFQFPWRLLSIVVFTTSVMSGLVMTTIIKRKLLVVLVIVLMLLFTNKDYWQVKGFLVKPESFYTGIYHSTTDTGESSPIWSVRFMEHEPTGHIEVIDGNAIVEELYRTSTMHDYKVNAVERVRLRENTLYFPGWTILIDGEQTDVEFQDPANRGVMTFFVDKGEHALTVVFRETKLRTVANVMSAISLVTILLYGILRKTHIWRRFR